MAGGIIHTNGSPEYTGSYNIIANGNIPIAGKKATQDITVNVDSRLPEETKVVDLAMASGNQIVTPTLGKVMTQVTVNKPITMLPENIKKDINIGGVVGTLEGIPVPPLGVIYGVRWLDSESTPGQSDPVGERFITDANGVTVYGSATNLVAEQPTLLANGTIVRPRNDFDNIRPWSTRKRVTDSKGNVMVDTEPFYYKKGYEIIEGVSYWVEAISIEQPVGFVLPRGFVEKSGNITTHNYTSAYEASNNGSGVAQSKSGFAPWVNITRATARSAASSISYYYHGRDLQDYDIFLMLFDIETATRNSQSVFAGVTSAPAAVNTGQTDGLNEVPSGGYINNTNGLYSFRYRFQENPYGNVFKFVMGVNLSSGNIYVCDDYSRYSDTTGSPYVLAGVLGSASGYAKKMGYNIDYPYVQLTTITGGSDTTYYCDYFSVSSSGQIVVVGGDWGNGASAGAHFWICDTERSTANSYFGFAFSTNTLS